LFPQIHCLPAKNGAGFREEGNDSPPSLVMTSERQGQFRKPAPARRQGTGIIFPIQKVRDRKGDLGLGRQLEGSLCVGREIVVIDTIDIARRVRVRVGRILFSPVAAYEGEGEWTFLEIAAQIDHDAGHTGQLLAHGRRIGGVFRDFGVGQGHIDLPPEKRTL